LVPGETYWIASDGRAAPLGLWTRTNVRGVPGGEHHFEFTNRIIRGADKDLGSLKPGEFVSNDMFGVKTGAIRAHIGEYNINVEAFGPVSQRQFRTISRYVKGQDAFVRWEISEPKARLQHGTGEGEISVVEFARASLGMLKSEAGFLNIIPSKSKGPFTFDNIRRAQELARKQSGSKFERFALGWSEFWRPWSTLPDSQLQLVRRYKFIGDLVRVGKFIDKQFKELIKYPHAIRKDFFMAMDGQIPIDAIPKDLIPVVKRMRRLNDWAGRMAVKRGLISEETFRDMHNTYIHYMYVKHFFPDEAPPSAGIRMDRGTFKRRKGLTTEQKQAIEIMEDVAIAFPTGIGKTLADIFKYDYFKDLAENPQITWQPGRVAVDEVPVMRSGKPTGKTRPQMMSIGEIQKEIKMYERMAAQKEGGLNPTAQARYQKLKNAELQASELANNAPEGFRQIPVSDAYGPLSGAFVRKPVYNDIVPLVKGLVADPESGWGKTIRAFETATTAFKIGKVPLNPPTVIRNIISNMIQMNMSGIPLYEVPFVVRRGIESFIKKDKFFRQGERMGLTSTNFTTAELAEISDVFSEIALKKGKGFWPLEAAGKLAKYYGRIDDIAKIALFRHAIERRGFAPGLAIVHAQKWGMDYSLVARGVKGGRRTVLPFVSYQYKIAPLIAETLRYRPWVIGKFAAAPVILAKWAAYKYNWTEDDVSAIRKELAERTRHKGNFVIIPWKDERGDVGFMNLQYYYPFGQWQDFLGDLMRGDLEAKDAVGFGGWWANIVHAIAEKQKGKPPVDPFSGTNIYSRFDSPQKKVLKTVEWGANLFLPSFVTRHGFRGYAHRAITGQRDQWGRKITPLQAAGRAVGANIGTLNKRQLKVMRKARMKAAFADFFREYHDPRASDSRRQELKRKYRDALRGIQRGEQ
jgi:hypothetical protein